MVAGGSIHAVHHSRQLVHYLAEHAAALNAMPAALFQVSLTSANPEKEHTAAAQGLVHELLGKTGFEPERASPPATTPSWPHSVSPWHSAW